MLTAFPPGGAPPAVNRQLPQGLEAPGPQQQGLGQTTPIANLGQLGGQMGMPAQQSGLNAPFQASPMGVPPPQSGGLGAPPGLGFSGSPEQQMGMLANSLGTTPQSSDVNNFVNALMPKSTY